MKYKLWWVALVAIALYFGFGILVLLAAGSTYLYLPIALEGDFQAQQARIGFIVTDATLAIVCGAWAGMVAADGDHTKKKERYRN